MVSNPWLAVSAFHVDDQELHTWCRTNRDRWVLEALQRKPRVEYSPDNIDIEINYPYKFDGEGMLRVHVYGYMPDAGKGVISVTHDMRETTHLVAWRVAMLVLRDAREKYCDRR